MYNNFKGQYNMIFTKKRTKSLIQSIAIKAVSWPWLPSTLFKMADHGEKMGLLEGTIDTEGLMFLKLDAAHIFFYFFFNLL